MSRSTRAANITFALGMLAVTLPIHGQEAVPPVNKYVEIAQSLEKFISAEMTAKEVSGLSIAIVDGDRIVWAKGFGFTDPEKRTAVTAETPFPVGSVSKLFTALIALQLAREGKIDLDAPVSKYLTGFKPKNTFGDPIRIRHLLSHCSGIVREAPIGSFFEPGNAKRPAMVESLNGTEIVYRPGTKYKYSNAAFGLAGHVIETAEKIPFEEMVQIRIFRPLHMANSSFGLNGSVKARMAMGQGWNRYGRTFPLTPNEYPAMAPAGGAISTVLDMGRFISALYPAAKTAGPFHPDDLQTAFNKQFLDIKAERTYGLGFILSDFRGKKKVSHGGALDGCVTELAVLPDEKLGVVVCANKDSANMLTRRIAEAALQQALAVKIGEALPRLQSSTPLAPGLARKLAGRYRSGADAIDIIASADRAWLAPLAGGPLKELRWLNESLIVDDALSYGTIVGRKGDQLQFDGKTYERVAESVPAPCPAPWLGLIGEYGTEANAQIVLEKDGKLHLLIEWFYLYPLKEDGPDRYRLPDDGIYPGEQVLFDRKSGAKASSMVVGAVKFDRRSIDGEDGATFKIKPARPIGEIRKEAMKAQPPSESGKNLKPDLVDLAAVDPAFKLDIRYATDNNFMGAPLYSSARAFLQRPAAEALQRASKKLAEKHYGILVFDCYRPWYVTKMFWEATPEKQRIFVADPARGSRHNRGCAADISLYDLKTGKPVEMVSGFDEFSDRSYPDYPGGTSLQRWHRQLLRDTMEAESFSVYEAEWWHYDFKDWPKYPIVNVRFEDLR